MKNDVRLSLKTNVSKRIVLFFFFSIVVFNTSVSAHTRGVIFEPAVNSTGKLVFYPNQDGYSSLYNTGFSTAVQQSPGDDVPEFVIAFKPFTTIGVREELINIGNGPDEEITRIFEGVQIFKIRVKKHLALKNP